MIALPHMKDTRILRAWRHAGEPDRIHYVLATGNKERHLFTDKGSKGGLYGQLDAELQAQGYTGPAS